MTSPGSPIDKRLRVSLLLDAYGELLTEKQRDFLRQYYEEDLSFGEIAADCGISRQAVFDSVRHGEESLEHFERSLRLIEHGWTSLMQAGWTAETLRAELRAARENLASGSLATAAATLEKVLAAWAERNDDGPETGKTGAAADGNTGEAAPCA